MGEPGKNTFRDLSPLVRWLRIALAAYVVVTLADAAADWQQIALIEQLQSGAQVTEEAAAANDHRQYLVGAAMLLVYLATGVLFLRWTYLAKKNAAALTDAALTFSPGWSVGYYFIPVLNLWKPYLALREGFQASHPDHRHEWRQAPRPVLLPLWWTLWLVSCFLGNGILRGELTAKTPEDLLTLSWVEFIAALLDLPLVALVWVLVATLQRWQTARGAAPAAGDASSGVA